MKHIPPPYAPPEESQMSSIHVDDDIIVVDKPSGLLSVPGIGPEKAFCAQSIAADRHGPALVVHRLDMDTSGVMIFARNAEAQRRLAHAFQARKVAKTYNAIVEGQMLNTSGRIDLAIAKFSHQRPLRHIDPEGRPSVTLWQLEDQMPATARLRLVPETGRSHQLRLHLSTIGHPILGDPFYGNQSLAPRLLLHATSLQLAHPTGGNPVLFETKVPF